MQAFWTSVLAALLFGLLLAGCLGAPEGADDGNDGSDGDPSPIPVTNRTVEWGDPATAGLRPGSSYDGFCTFNWLFTDDEGNAYVGTAGHCTELRNRAELQGAGEIGTVVFDSDDTPGADAGVDFALILIDPDAVANAHPGMLGQNGPTGVAETPMAGDLVALHGHGMVFGDQDETRDRIGVLVEITEKEYRANMPAVWGDSGAPVLHHETGTALGIISRFGLEPPVPTTDVGPRLPWILGELERAGFAVELATV